MAAGPGLFARTALIIAFLVAGVYKELAPGFDPLLRTAAITIVVMLLDALTVAPLFERNYAMFRSFIGTCLGTCLPFVAIFAGCSGQRLLGDRAKDRPNAALEMEMDRGRTDAQRLGEPAQAEPVCADALDQLGGGGDDRSLRETGAGSGLPFFLSIWTRGLRCARCAARFF